MKEIDIVKQVCVSLTCWLMVMAVGCLCAFSFIGSMAVAPSH